jgi:hypothetical protein
MGCDGRGFEVRAPVSGSNPGAPNTGGWFVDMRERLDCAGVRVNTPCNQARSPPNSLEHVSVIHKPGTPADGVDLPVTGHKRGLDCLELLVVVQRFLSA